MLWDPQVCRICAHTSDVCFPIFEKGGIRNLEVKIKKCLSLNIYKGDFKPKVICNSCVVKLSEFYNFLELSHSSNTKFDILLYQSSQSCHNVSEEWHEKSSSMLSSPTQDNSVIVLKSEGIASCNDIMMMVQCKNDILTIDSIELQNQCMQNQNELNLVSSADTFNNVINMQLKGFVNEAPNNAVADLKKNVNSSFNSSQTVLRHSSNYDNNEHLQYVDVSNMQNKTSEEQLNKLSSPLKYLQMDLNIPYMPTDAMSNVSENLNRVQNMQSTKKKKSCGKTDLKAAQNKELTTIPNEDASQSIHNFNILSNNMLHFIPQESVQAENNSKTNTTTDPSVKRSFENKLKPFPCPNCDKAFMRKLTLNAHMATHTNIRPYTCEVCNKSFAIRWNLTCHKRVHTSLYRCQHCLKCFTVPSKLQRHLRIHTGTKPFVCQVKNCGRSFSDKRNLVGHQSSHTDARDFVCDMCKKAFKTKSKLKEHKKTHNSDAPFKCDTCGKAYKWKTNLVVHAAKHKFSKCSKSKKDCKAKDGDI